MTGATLDELGYYLLADVHPDPGDLLSQARAGEEMGLGTALLAERWTMSGEAATLVGAACAATTRLRLATAATNHNLRHPVVTAAWAATAHRISHGRFTLGIGPGAAAVYRAFGLPPVDTAQMRDWAALMRRLWRGETIEDHDGPAGRYPLLRIACAPEEDTVPLGLVAFHDEDLALGGAVFDEVVLHTFLDETALRHAKRTVADAAEAAGRDPGAVRVWSCVVTAGDHLPEEIRLRKTVARLANYLQYLGDELVAANDWDPSVLRRFRDDPVVASFDAPIEGAASADQLAHIANLVPDAWLATAATGSAESCAARLARELERGADRVILHGATPDEFAPVIAAYRAARK